MSSSEKDITNGTGDTEAAAYRVKSKSSDIEGAVKETESPSSPNRVVDDFGFTEAEQKAIIRRTDYRLVLTVGAMYCVSLMDRTNLGAANIAGMDIDLDLIGNDHYVSVSFL